MIRHKFLIGDVLKKVTTQKLPLKAKTLPKITNGDKSLVPLMAAGVENQGCVGYVNPNEPTVLHNLITVSANGANSGATFYQQRKFSILQDAYALELVDKYADYASDNVYLYLTAVVDHRLKDNGYNNKATWNRIKNYYIELPVTPAGDPDFEYMTARIRELEAERIRELEAERIRELEAYLRVTGLDDTTLSASEAQALTQKVQWKKFKINDFFKVLPVKHKLIKRELLSCGQYPCYSSDTSNYGILGYTNNPEFHIDDKHSYLIFGDHTRSMRIVEGDFSVLDNVKVLWGPKLSKEKLLFIETMWHKAIPNLGYARHWLVAKNVDFLLPVTSTGDVDFDYMQNYIRAMEKQTIKGVVEYKDQVIAETKKVVNE